MDRIPNVIAALGASIERENLPLFPGTDGTQPPAPGIQTPRGHHPRGVLLPPKIIVATPAHMRFVVHLQRKFSNQLGFLPTEALVEYVDRRDVGIVLENGEPAGYILGRTSYKFQRLMRPITQAAIAMDAQRRHLGLALVDRLAKKAAAFGQLALQAVCREDLEANEFWLAAGFRLICQFDPDNARQKKLLVWRKAIGCMKPAWFETPPPRASIRTQST